MRRTHLILLAACATMAMSAIGGIGASSALAIGPLWLVENTEVFHCHELTGGKFKSLLECLSAGIFSENSGTEWELLALGVLSGRNALPLHLGVLVLSLNLGNFKLVAGTLITIECTHVHDEGTIQGGVPGKDHEIIYFLKCTVAGRSKCHVNSPGQALGTVVTKAKTELVLKEKEEGKHPENLLVLFEPQSGESFVTLEITPLVSGDCPIGTSGTHEVKGKVAGFLEPETEEPVAEGKLTFPTNPIGKVFRWKKEGEPLEEVKTELTVFGIVKAKEVGVADIWPEGGGKIGAHCLCL